MSDPTRSKPTYSQPRLGGMLFSFNITLTAEERDLIVIGHANCIGIGRYMHGRIEQNAIYLVRRTQISTHVIYKQH